MDRNGQALDYSAKPAALRWSGRVVSAEDLRFQLNGHREIVLAKGTLITPLAAEHLRDRGVQVSWQPEENKSARSSPWGYAQERLDPLVQAAVKALEREGQGFQELPGRQNRSLCRWSQELAGYLADGSCTAGIVFSPLAGLVCCVANKIPGVRAVALTTVQQAAQAFTHVAPNLIVIDMPGRTFFEIRQIMRAMCAGNRCACPAELASTLKELDGHAHC